MSCEQTLNNINSVVNAMSNTQGDMVSDVEQLKKNWEDFSTLFAQLVEQAKQALDAANTEKN